MKQRTSCLFKHPLDASEIILRKFRPELFRTAEELTRSGLEGPS